VASVGGDAAFGICRGLQIEPRLMVGCTLEFQLTAPLRPTIFLDDSVALRLFSQN
jgi:hypothetical protein